MSREDILRKYGERVGFTNEDMEHITADDPRMRHLERLSEVARKYSIQAKVIEARHCNSGYKIGDTFTLDVDGNFITKLCPKRMCVYAVSQLVVPRGGDQRATERGPRSQYIPLHAQGTMPGRGR